MPSNTTPNGRKVTTYCLERLVGCGGFAEVYKARDARGCLVALKMLRPLLAAIPQERARFRQETRLMNAVRHPGVPRAIAEGETAEGQPGFAMTWIDGETLDARRRRMGGRLPLAEVVVVGSELANIVGAVHAAGVLHRDIKPENVFIDRDGHVILSDFGIACWADRADDGAACGTPIFMATEQFTGSGLGPWTDVRAIAATLFVLLTGQTPCPTACVSYLPALLSGKVRPLRALLPTAPPRLSHAIDLALAPDPAARPSLRELGAACRDA